MTSAETSEKEKMCSGELHFPSAKELCEARLRTKRVCQEANNQPYTDAGMARRKELIQGLLGGENAYAEPPFFVDYDFNLAFGKDFYANHSCTILNSAMVEVGDRVMLGPGVVISTPSHPLDRALRASGAEVAKPVKIGSDVWLGANVTVCQGVTIGDNVVVGANSVVTKDLAGDAVYGGTPAKLIKKINQ